MLRKKKNWGMDPDGTQIELDCSDFPAKCRIAVGSRSTVVLCFQFHGTHDHILLSDVSWSLQSTPVARDIIYCCPTAVFPKRCLRQEDGKHYREGL
jgi:hypothetical protein